MKLKRQISNTPPIPPSGVRGIQHHAFVAANYLTLTKAEMARQLGCSTCGVQGILKRLNLVIPLNIIAERKLIGLFKNGQIPPNKGKKQTEYMSAGAIANTEKTRFKKGQIAHNCNNEIGKITIRKEKSGRPYKYICIALGKWELYHRHIWQQTYGTIPKWHCIRFKDGNSLNCTIENLECITLKENRYRNAGHQTLTPSYLARCIVGKNGNTDTLLTETQLLEAKKTHILINRKIKQNGKQ